MYFHVICSSFSPRIIRGIMGGHGLGVACDHIKVLGVFPFPHQRKICPEGLQGWLALSVLGRTLIHVYNWHYYSATSMIWTCLRSANTSVCMCRGHGWWSFRDVATVERWAWQFYRLVWPILVYWPVYFMNTVDHDHALHVMYSRYRFINQARKVGTPIIKTISLIRYISPVDKRVWIIVVALYVHVHVHVQM